MLSRLITIAVSLVSVPVVISYLGIAGYGVWESIIAVSVLCNVAQTTISGTLLWKFSGAFGSGDHAAALYYVRIGVFASLALCCLITPIAWCSRQVLVDLFHVPVEFRSSAEVILPRSNWRVIERFSAGCNCKPGSIHSGRVQLYCGNNRPIQRTWLLEPIVWLCRRIPCFPRRPL